MTRDAPVMTLHGMQEELLLKRIMYFMLQSRVDKRDLLSRREKKKNHHILNAVIMLYFPQPDTECQLYFQKTTSWFRGTDYWAPLYLFIYIFWLSCGIEGNSGSRTAPAASSGVAPQRCSVAGRRYRACLIREWEDLNPPGLGPAELKIAGEDLKIRLPRLCNAHSSPSL